MKFETTQILLVLVLRLVFNSEDASATEVSSLTIDKLVMASTNVAIVRVEQSSLIGHFGDEECGVLHIGHVEKILKGPDLGDRLKFFSYSGFAVGNEYVLFLSSELPFSENIIERMQDKRLIPEVRACQSELLKHDVQLAVRGRGIHLTIANSDVATTKRWVEFDPTSLAIDNKTFDVQYERIKNCQDKRSDCVVVRQRQLVSLDSLIDGICNIVSSEEQAGSSAHTPESKSTH